MLELVKKKAQSKPEYDAKLQKLRIQKSIDMVTGAYKKLRVPTELFKRARKKKILDRKILSCKLCKDMNIKGISEAVPGYGSLMARVFFVGQSLCTQCMATQIPFTEKSGYYIDIALKLCGMTREQVFISNLVHCHPPKNRQSKEVEKSNCIPFLIRELKIIKPDLVIGLGRDSHNFLLKHYNPWDYRDTWTNHTTHSFNWVGVPHPASYLYGNMERAIDWCIELALLIEEYA